MSHTSTLRTAAHGTAREPAERFASVFHRFARLSASGGIVLLMCAVAALIWANSPFGSSYFGLFNQVLSVELERPHIHLEKPLVVWINDLLMAVFFFLVGLEIKREILVGELASVRRAALPIAAAIGGMVVPGVIYAALNWGQPTLRGWGVPVATDIAFALGVLMLMGTRAPIGLRVFLTSLAIVDDLGALIVIAVFYTEQLNLEYLGLAGIPMALMIGASIARVRAPWVYLVIGGFLWYFILKCGVHATIAGVLSAMTIPASPRVDTRRFVDSSRAALDHFERHGEEAERIRLNADQRAAARVLARNCKLIESPLHRLEHALHGWVAFFILPLFALANAGVQLSAEGIGELIRCKVTVGVVLGLVLGKPVGIVLASLLAVKLRIAELPSETTWRHIIGAGCLGGIGFTMSLFIASLAFTDPAGLDAAKVGILAGSAISGVLGLGVLLTIPRGSAQRQSRQ